VAADVSGTKEGQGIEAADGRPAAVLRVLDALVAPIALIAVFVLWELGVGWMGISEFLLPRPTTIIAELADQWNLIFRHGVVTLIEVIVGFGLSIAVGIPLAVLIVYSRPIERVVHPLLVGAQTIPKVALAPLFIVWLGFGLAPKVVVVFLIAFFPIVISTIVGLRSCPPEMLHLVRSMGASGFQKFWMIRFPQALPSIFGGLKVGITLAVVGALVGEFVGASQGLGYLIGVARGNLDTPFLFAAIAAVSLMGVVLFLAVDILERRVLHWHVSTRLDEMRSTM
jgi:NitT/TauT family transport system permease protein